MTSDFVCSMDKPVILTPKEYQEYMLETNKSDYLIKKLRHQGCPELTKEDVKHLATEMRQRDILEKKLMKDFPRGKSRLFKTAKEAVWKSGQYAYIGRRLKKRDFRKLWITRISAAAKSNGMNYSTFMNGLKKAGITLNRKMLSEIAINDAAGFTALTEKAKAAL